MGELIFLVEEAPEGGFTARALGQVIFTEVAARCHFEEGRKPSVIRLHFAL
jgi:hypothetical protein